jgi:hypothetical protein
MQVHKYGRREKLCIAAVGRSSQHLSFLFSAKLARFSTVSGECRGVATMDRLWMPLLARHFADVVPPTPLLLLSPARRFRVLALIPCSVCNQILHPLKPRAGPVWIRYSASRSCGFCGLLCCATCHCQCRCLNDVCNIEMLVHNGLVPVEVVHCRRCHG